MKQELWSSHREAEHGHISPFSGDRQFGGLGDTEAPLGLAGADLLVLLSPVAACRFPYKDPPITFRRLPYMCKI